jgi:hypothetical protein
MQEDTRPPPLKLYSELTGIYPNPESPQRQLIIDTIGVDQAALDRWRYAITAWMLCDYKRTNVSGLLSWYVNGVPQDKRPPGLPAPPESATLTPQEEQRAKEVRDRLERDSNRFKAN